VDNKAVVDARGHVVAAIGTQRGVQRLVVSFNTGRSRLRCVSHYTQHMHALYMHVSQTIVLSLNAWHWVTIHLRMLSDTVVLCPQRQARADGQVHGGGVPRRRRQRWRAGLVHRLLPARLQVKGERDQSSTLKRSEIAEF
jgi:hypothetical protein